MADVVLSTRRATRENIAFRARPAGLVMIRQAGVARGGTRQAGHPSGLKNSFSSPPRPASGHPSVMNVALWIAQGLVALAMLAAGGLKVATPRVKLAEKLKWAATWSDANVKLLGLAEALGAVGLIMPWLTGIAPVLTPVAAVALTVIMGGAVKTHVDRKEPLVPPAVLGALCVFIALGRFGVL